jgi:transcription initiation factor TFIID subunit 7
MKLKLKNPNAAPSDAPPSEPPPSDAPTPVSAKPGGLKLKLKPSAPASGEPVDSQNGEATKVKRKYTKKPKLDESGNVIPPGKPGPKKRAREDGTDDFDSPAAKRKPKPTAKSLAMANDTDDEDDYTAVEQPPTQPIKPHNRTQSIKLSIKPKGAMGSARPSTAILKVKGAGKPPVRPYGVGYDSEAEEAEPDPAIESQFVLRMKPGPDCDLLRKSIEEKTIGKSVSQGGPGVHFRFFDREGRRAMLTIQNRMYAATMVELPAVIESLKSWNKKDWVKTADVCQMLLVLDQVKNEDEARKYPLPSYIPPDTHRFPHGLTPPMKWARKRRFRPRKSYIDVERAEAHLNRLIGEDDNAVSTKYEMVDSDAESSEESSSEEEVDDDDEMADAHQVEEMDADQLEQMLAEGLMDDEVELQGDNDQLNALLAGNNNVQVEQVDTPTTAHDVAMHALGQNGNLIVETETAASTPAAATSADDDDDDDDADSDEDVDEVDEAAAAEEQRQEQLRGEIAELERAIIQSTEARDRQTNVLFKKRVQTQIDKQKADLAIKRKQLNEEADE